MECGGARNKSVVQTNIWIVKIHLTGRFNILPLQVAHQLHFFLMELSISGQVLVFYEI